MSLRLGVVTVASIALGATYATSAVYVECNGWPAATRETFSFVAKDFIVSTLIFWAVLAGVLPLIRRSDSSGGDQS